MLRRFTRKRWIAALCALTALVVAGAAIAYFTAGGAGTGSAAVGTVTPSNIVISGSVASDQYLFPGGSAVTVPITVKNTSSAPVKVGSVTLTKIDADSGHAGCDVSLTGGTPAFTMTPATVNQTVAPGATSDPINGSLRMNDTGVSQDACQGATLTLTFASTAGS